MAVTYVQLVNELLRRLNEVALDSAGSGFGTVKGVHALAKDAINNSIREVIQYNQEWPFTLTTYTETMVSGTSVYSFQSDMSSVDWESFYIKQLTAAGNQPHKLPVITYNDYLRNHRPSDDVASSGDYTVPTTVYKTQTDSFGVTPLPDDVYEIEYKYFTFASDLNLYTDTTVIPDRFRYVIIDGAMMYMMRFRSNDQQGEIHRAKFDKGVKDMRRILLDEPDYVSSTALARGGFSSNFVRVIN